MLELHESAVGQDSIMVRLLELLMVKLWNSGSSDWLVVAFMELSAQQIRFARWITLLNAFVWLDMMLFSGSNKYLLLSLFTGYMMFSLFITSSLDSGSTLDTSSVVVRSLVAQCVEDVLVGTRVVITIAVLSFLVGWIVLTYH